MCGSTRMRLGYRCSGLFRLGCDSDTMFLPVSTRMRAGPGRHVTACPTGSRPGSFFALLADSPAAIAALLAGSGGGCAGAGAGCGKEVGGGGLEAADFASDGIVSLACQAAPRPEAHRSLAPPPLQPPPAPFQSRHAPVAVIRAPLQPRLVAAAVAPCRGCHRRRPSPWSLRRRGARRQRAGATSRVRPAGARGVPRAGRVVMRSCGGGWLGGWV